MPYTLCVNWPVLVLHCGNSTETLRACCGDHDAWFSRALTHSTVVCDVFLDEKPPDPAEVAGMVITGSPQSVTEPTAWMEATAEYIRRGMRKGAAILGVCFGHQLIAYALGARVVRNPRGWELGTQPVRLTDAGVADPIFRGAPNPFLAHMSHQDVVEAVVPGMTLLASSDVADVQAFAAGERVRGVQFHPEADQTIATLFIRQRDDKLRAAGYDTDGLAATIQETPIARQVLHNFEKHLCRTR